MLQSQNLQLVHIFQQSTEGTPVDAAAQTIQFAIDKINAEAPIPGFIIELETISLDLVSSLLLSAYSLFAPLF